MKVGQLIIKARRIGKKRWIMVAINAKGKESFVQRDAMIHPSRESVYQDAKRMYPANSPWKGRWERNNYVINIE